MNNLSDKNRKYWLQRAEGYSKVNQEELDGIQRSTWSKLLRDTISAHAGKTEDIKVLDIGCGPGFISIILSEMGCRVTAADFAETMLEEAKANAGVLAEKICFIQQDAMNLGFGNESFDVVISRNLTWNLPDPEKAYKEWLRVLKKGGLMMVFDANWYSYLMDEEKKASYEEDRKNVADADLEDYNIGENFDLMEDIARKLPLSGKNRPAWDKEILEIIGFKKVKLNDNIGKSVYSEKELINYSSTPMFMITAEKDQ